MLVVCPHRINTFFRHHNATKVATPAQHTPCRKKDHLDQLALTSHQNGNSQAASLSGALVPQAASLSGALVPQAASLSGPQEKNHGA